MVGSKNIDLGVASASRPLGLKVVGAMDRLAIALKQRRAREAAGHDVSAPRRRHAAHACPRATAGADPEAGADADAPHHRHDFAAAGALGQHECHGADVRGGDQHGGDHHGRDHDGRDHSAAHAASMTSNAAAVHAASMPAAMTAAAPAATVLPSMTLQPNVAPLMEKTFEKSLNEKPVTEKTVDRILQRQAAGEDRDAPRARRRSTCSRARDAAVSLGAVGRGRAVEHAHQPARGAESVAPHAAGADRDAAAGRLAAHRRQDRRPADAAGDLPPPLSSKIAEAPMQAAPPAAPVVTVHVAPPAAPVMPAAVPTPRHEEHNFRVLAVDDSPLMRTFLRTSWSLTASQPEFASSGEEALFKISKQHFDLIFLDVMLPGMDGYDVCKMIKKNKDNNLMKVVMLTSKDKTFDKIRGTMAGCDGYLTKPVDEMKLRAIIERHSVTQK